MMYAVSSSGLFQSENGGGDVLRDRKHFTDMEKLKFRRNCREDFEKHVENVIKDEATVSYAPRNASPDNILWRCLEERNGDEDKIVEIVLKDIKHYKPVRENDECLLLKFIDNIENADPELGR